jgi:hypothetical protein
MTLPTADPLRLAARLWPDVRFYQKQREVIAAVEDCDEVFVPAGNMLGVCPLPW